MDKRRGETVFLPLNCKRAEMTTPTRKQNNNFHVRLSWYYSRLEPSTSSSNDEKVSQTQKRAIPSSLRYLSINPCHTEHRIDDCRPDSKCRYNLDTL
jgi:hypothetical protein